MKKPQLHEVVQDIKDEYRKLCNLVRQGKAAAQRLSTHPDREDIIRYMKENDPGLLDGEDPLDVPESLGRTLRFMQQPCEMIISAERDWRWFEMGEFHSLYKIVPSELACRATQAERLPYPCTAISVDLIDKDGNVALIHLFCAQIGDDRIRVLLALTPRHETQARIVGRYVDCRKKLNGDGELEWEVGFDKDEDGKLPQSTDLALQTYPVLALLKVLACNNIYVEREPYPKALRKNQEKKGKVGGYTKHVLCIKGAEGEKEVLVGETGGSHASPRLHFRRGHIRRYPSGVTVWVREHMVGRGPGFVDKDYEVKGNAL